MKNLALLPKPTDSLQNFAAPQRVLIIEDEPEQAVVLQRWIEREFEWEVDVADNGTTGMQGITDSRHSMIVTDIGLPGTDGLRILETSKRLFPERPVIVVTAFEGRSVLLEALRKNADEFLSKPLSRAYATTRLKRLARTKKEGARVLAISAHPDDVEIGVGGTLLKHRQEGAQIHLVVATDGARGGERELRRRETHAAAERLGASVSFLNLDDGNVPSGTETIGLLEGIVREFEPNYVYTHTVRDTHQDHRAIAQASRVATRGVERVFCYQSPSTTIEFRPTKFSRIAEQLSQKQELIQCYASQHVQRDYLQQDVVASTAQYWGRYSGFTPSEPLEVIRDSD